MTGLLDMPPSLSTGNPADVASSNAKAGRDTAVLLPTRSAGSNLAHKIVVQLGGFVVHAPVSAVRAPVGIVLDPRAPVKIFDTVVGRHAIPVARFVPVWPCPHECLKNKVVDVAANPRSASLADRHDEANVVFALRAGNRDESHLFPLVPEPPLVVAEAPHRTVRSNPVARIVRHGAVFNGVHSSSVPQVDRSRN